MTVLCDGYGEFGEICCFLHCLMGTCFNYCQRICALHDCQHSYHKLYQISISMLFCGVLLQ